MAEKRWYAAKQQYCKHAGGDVKLEIHVVLPPEFLPDQPPRVIGHRCSFVCAGTYPNYDPLIDQD